MDLNTRVLDEKINLLKKSLEIVGGTSYLNGENTNNDTLLQLILEKALNGEVVKFDVNNNSYSIQELLKKKQAYEIYFLKNKSKALQSIVFKIKKYDTSLDSLIRKYKKCRGLEEYNEIYNTISKRYRLDINKIVLSEIDEEVVSALTIEDEAKYYGEYLDQKKKQIIDGVISKMGIV